MGADGRVNVMLKTEDMTSTLDWYQRAGFRVRGRFPEDTEPTWIELARDDVVVQFLAGETPWPEVPSLTGTIYLYPESVRALHEQIRGQIEPAWGPEVREWGMLEMGLQDPNGYFLTFTEPADGS
jgi:catechol 2,3-dioxygenase-like lactoylglutathione lyase family enzyme